MTDAMARHTRLRDPNLIRHVMSRGNGKMRIFLDEDDYQKFFRVLHEVLDRYDVECWDFCAMPNHYHLTLRNRRPNLSDALQHLNGEYATWWNAAHQRVGHVFQGRYKDQIVQDDDYVRSLTRYIALNPVRAGLVDRPEQWPWSSYRCTAGLCATPSFLASERVLARFGATTLEERRRQYTAHVLQSSDEEEVKIASFRSRLRVIGTREFKLALLSKEAPSAPSPSSGIATFGFI